MEQYILALDQGTTSSRAILFDYNQNIVAMSQKEFTQFYPQNGYVEHNPLEIYSSQYAVMMEVIAQSNIKPEQIAAIGITNQRETTIMWDKKTGKPIYNAIVWQCRRSADICKQIIEDGYQEHIQKTTGLLIDAYFSATKIKWILDNVPDARTKAKEGNLLFGTVDTWLLWKLTEGKVHATDYTNASRTMLFDINRLEWDQTLLDYLDIPRECLPQVLPSDSLFGYTNISGHNIPICGIAGDQQAALFGQQCFTKGSAKNTYGTGCFLLMNTGNQPVTSKNGLLTTIGIGTKNNLSYALEGSVFVGGAVIQWLRDEMKLISDSADSEYFATKVKDNGGVYLVPAFTGLGAPYWDMQARGSIFGITRSTTKNHIIRAALEAIAYQVNDIIVAMEHDLGQKTTSLRIDGGAAANAVLAQFQADITDITVIRPANNESTALGAAYLAGLSIGYWTIDDLIRQENDQTFSPNMSNKARQHALAMWHKAVQRSLAWNEEE